MRGDRVPAVELVDWSVTLGGRAVLSDIDLSAYPGELVGLVGPNGAGKSTLLRSIIMMPQPTGGAGRVFGRDISRISTAELARMVALMPQNLVLSFPFPAEEVVMMGRHPHLSRFQRESDEDWRIVRESMTRTDTAGLSRRIVTSLSGGETQLISMAKTLAQTAPVMLLDEPTASLDLRHQELIFGVVREFASAGGCAIVAIHDLGLAARYCTRIVLLKDGRIVAEGDAHQVFNAELLSSVYDIRVVVYNDPVSGAPAVLPVSEASSRQPESGASAGLPES